MKARFSKHSQQHPVPRQDLSFCHVRLRKVVLCFLFLFSLSHSLQFPSPFPIFNKETIDIAA
ncbi:hypothetical protein P5F80_09365 [Shouchella clausii]|uniref:hypothetical protein n=1 Tax=Shouchella clausii TaxID=79880 RepID=UPI00115506B3|nr:hypothetical protein [Shouchella clausii]MED4176736.1 hypothetical protein [Shouchella clausii]